MQKIALVLACLACTGNAAPDEQTPPESTAEAAQSNTAQALATLLLAHEQAISAFTPSGLPATAAGQMPMNRQGPGAVMQVDLLGRPLPMEYWTTGEKRQQAKRDKAAQKDPRDMTPEEMNECLEAMTLSNLKPCPGSKRKAKRKGRGMAAGQGKTCGFGNRGQKARSGKVKPFQGFEGGQNPLYRRLPKYVGRPMGPGHKQEVYSIIKMDALEKCHDGEEIDYTRLFRRRLVGKTNKRRYIYKVLGVRGGKPLTTKNLKVRAHAFSMYAKEQIEANGGKCIFLAKGSNKEIPMPRKYSAEFREERAAARQRYKDLQRGIAS